MLPRSNDPSSAAMNAIDLLRALREKGVQLSVDGDRLRAAAPSGVIDSGLQDAIRRLKPALVDLLVSEAAESGSVAAIADAPLRLSPAQERLWLFQQLDPASTTYNLTPSITIEGPLDRPRLEAALRRVLQRHEPLRSMVGEEHPGGVIRTVPVPEHVMTFVDLTHLPPEQAADRLREKVQEAQHQPFDLAREIPFRATLVQLDHRTHVFITTLHHIAIDGMSLQHFYRDLATCYGGGEPDPLKASYAEYVAWQRDHWTPDALQSRAAYWRAALDGVPTVLELPTDRPRGSAQTFTGGMVSRELGTDEYHAIRTLGQVERASLFMVISAAFSAALHHHTGQRSFVLGTPLHGRERSEHADLVGMFVNQLPLPVRIPRDATLRSLVRGVRETVLAGMTEHEMPFGSLIEALGLPRDSTRSPVFQVMVNVLPGSNAAPGMSSGGVTLRLPPAHELLAVFDGQAKLDITLYALQREGDLHFALVYNADVFSRDRMTALLEDTVSLVTRGAARPDVALCELIRTPAPRLPVTGSPEWIEPWPEESVAARFDRIASRFADRVAVISGSEEKTYAGLRKDVERIARLVAAATKPAAVVGVFIPHDASVPSALLGVLRSGRTYLPLDPRYPDERLALMVSDAGVDAVVTTAGLRRKWEALAPDTSVILLDDAPAADAELPPVPGPDNLAYLLYTSGSTSRPKAVVQSQGNLAHQAGRYAGALSIGPQDRVALLASISFDASLMDLFGALLTGAAIAPIDPRAIDLSELPRLLTAQRLTVLHVTPTVFRTLGRAAAGKGFPTIRAVDLGGERVRLDDIELFDRTFPPGAILVNSYGPSEHTFALGHILDRTQRSTEIPIGAPLADVEVLLLDAEGREDPVAGEMVLRSRYGALRYWNRPDLTATAFMPDPALPGRTMYRTGDIVRRRPDGTYIYMHRADDQLKVRGHRIEPQEVEAVLNQHPAIAEVAVHGPPGFDGTTTLTACVVWSGEQKSASELAAWCSEHLPPFMIPAVWLTAEALPRTPSGKVDRRNLPAAERHAGDARADAHDAEEAEVLQIWNDILDAPDIGVHDDFFVSGGHSLTATQVVARVRDVFGIELPLRQFFDHPTVAATAQWIRDHRGATAPLPAIVHGEHGAQAPLSFAQERVWFLQQMDTAASAYNISGATLLEGPFDVERFRVALDAVARRQESLRTRFNTVAGKPVQVVAAEPDHEFTFIDASAWPAEERFDRARNTVHDQLEAPYDLQQGGLVRTMVVGLGDERHLIGIGMHHAIADMWSFAVLGRELRAAYDRHTFEELPVTYRDYALWQRQTLSGDALDEQRRYWRGKLAGVPALELATDFPRPPFFAFDGAMLQVALPATLRDAISRFAADNRVTPFMTLLAGFDVLMAAYSNQTDFAVGVPSAGRKMTETQNLIGMFVSTMVHRNDLSGTPTFRQLVQRVRTTALDAYAHQDTPFELLVRELDLPRDPSRSPLVQVLFNVANMRVDGFALEGITHTGVPLPKRAAQFDLGLNIGLNEVQSELHLTYNTTLFTRDTAERMLSHYLEIMSSAVAHPDQNIASLAAPPPSDRELLLRTWNDGSRALPDASCVTLLVERTANGHPDSVAVESPTGSFTYAELLDYAKRVTAALQVMGVEPGDRVAIVMQRSREMLGALIGILGAGAAYVPVDPTYPPARVRHMLEDAGVVAVVTHRGFEAQYAPDAPVLDLDRWTPPTAAEFVHVTSDQPAYVIYTSGSTGKPKGVEVPHGAMVNFLHAMRELPGIAAGDTMLAVTTISFDIAVLELYLPLVAGARVVIAGEEDVLDGRKLARKLDEAGVTIMQATPATWKLLVAAGWQGRRGTRVLCGGEPLTRALADDLLDRAADVWNMYGPTETTVWSTMDRVERDSPILVGRPIANTTLYVLGENLELRPVGVPGELYIGGAGVANGYLNLPDLTAERFIESPFRAGERLYRTGDLVRYRSDGRIEHLGRLDNQVKVRGFRIELGEVEAALQSHSAVRDAVVIANDDRLVAYVVFADGGYATGTELRSWVSGTLPPYMVPSFIATLDALPLTPNGKIDRKQLPDPSGHHDEQTEWVAPDDPAGIIIAEVWSSLLGIERVGVGENFFELGGHSLLAMEAVALIEERTGQRLEPRSLFFMTLGELAGTIPLSGSAT